MRLNRRCLQSLDPPTSSSARSWRNSKRRSLHIVGRVTVLALIPAPVLFTLR